MVTSRCRTPLGWSNQKEICTFQSGENAQPPRLARIPGAILLYLTLSERECERETLRFVRLIFAHAQHREEGFLGNINFADALHAALSRFLLLQQLALARDVA